MVWLPSSLCSMTVWCIPCLRTSFILRGMRIFWARPCSAGLSSIISTLFLLIAGNVFLPVSFFLGDFREVGGGGPFLEALRATELLGVSVSEPLLRFTLERHFLALVEDELVDDEL